MIIALTGSIASGKSTAAELFSKAGYLLINADQIGHELYTIDEIKNKILNAFGRKILTKGEIDRRKLKDIVFYEPKKLIKLNKIMHPEIIKEINNIIKKNQGKDVLIDGALIIEAGFSNYDRLILITIDKDVQLKRLLKKGKYNKEEINNIIKSQLNQHNKIRYADDVIDNSGSKNKFKRDIKKLIAKLK